MVPSLAAATLSVVLTLAPSWPVEAPADTVDVSGTWIVSYETPQGTLEMVLVLEQEGEKLTGVAQMPRGEAPVEGKVKKKSISFTLTLGREPRTVELKFRGEVEGDEAEGRVRGPRGQGGRWTARRPGS